MDTLIIIATWLFFISIGFITIISIISRYIGWEKYMKYKLAYVEVIGKDVCIIICAVTGLFLLLLPFYI